MEDKIILNFGNIVNELTEKKLKFGFIKTNMKIMCVIDNVNNIYSIEDYYLGSYLDKLIKNRNTVTFKRLENKIIEEWQIEIFDINNFYKRLF